MRQSAPSLLHSLMITGIITFLLSTSPSTGFCGEQLQDTTLVPLHITKGTNLINIARKYCHNRKDWKTIARVNQLKAPYLIIENTTLQVPLALLKVEHFSARIVSVHGSVHSIRNKKITGEVKKNDTLLPGQTIVTGEASYAHLIFPDHKYTRVAPNSELTINYLIRLTDGKHKAELFLKKGRLIHSIKQKLQKNETFRTKTPVSITGIRGTEFRLKMVDDATNITETLTGRVQISAGGKTIGLNKGQGSRVEKGKAPTPPQPLPKTPTPPQLEPIYKILPVVLAAPEHKTATFIHLRLTRDRQGKETILEKQIAPGQDFILTTLTDGFYFCFLTAVDDDLFESLPAGPFPLKVRTIPAAPVLSAPGNDLVTWDKNIDVKWLKSEHADHYRIELASDPEFSHLLESSPQDGPNYRTPGLRPGTYSFRVQAVAPDGFTSLFSLPLTWTIDQPSALTPITGSLEKGLEVRWSAATYKAVYELQIGRQGNFDAPVLFKKGLSTPSYTITTYLEPGDYHVRIRSVLEDGQISPWTPPQILTIDQEPFGIDHALIILTLLVLIVL